MKYSLTEHYKYKLEETEMRETPFTGYEFDNRYMKMLDNGQLFVQAGYAWDGSSIPHKGKIRALSYLNPLVWVRIKDAYDADKYCKTASLIHDALCQAMRERLLPSRFKLRADTLYREMCMEGGMSKRQAERRYNVVHKFGLRGIVPEKNPRNKIYDTDEPRKV